MDGERGRGEEGGRLTYEWVIIASVLANISRNGQYFQKKKKNYEKTKIVLFLGADLMLQA